MVLAVRFSVEKFEQKSAHGRNRQTSRFAFESAKTVQICAAKKPHPEKRQSAHSAPFVCDALLQDGYDIRTVQELL